MTASARTMAILSVWVLSLLGQPLSAQEATPIPNQSGRLGVYGEGMRFDNGVRAVRVTGVINASPAQRLRLVDGSGQTFHMAAGRDYITEVNGIPVKSFAQLKTEIARSERRCVLKIYDSRTKYHEEYYTYLR